jgi:hypothetical protein
VVQVLYGPRIFKKGVSIRVPKASTAPKVKKHTHGAAACDYVEIMRHPSGPSGTDRRDPTIAELGACLLVEVAHRAGHDVRREHDAQFGEVAVQLRSQLSVGDGAQRERDVIHKFVHLIFLRHRKRGLRVAKTPGDCIRIGAHHSLDRGTERLGPFRRRPERPRRAPDDDGNQSNNNDAVHTHDGIDKVPARVDLRLRWPLLVFATALRGIPVFQ